MNTKTLLLGAAATLMTATAANAGHFNGWYVGLEAGTNAIDDANIAIEILGEPTTGIAEFDSGWAVLATAGYAFTNNWRLEAELGYRQNETTSGTAQVDEWSLMVNALYDIDLSPSWGLTLGVGAGYDSANFDFLGTDEDDGNLAYQGIAGLNFAVGPRTDLTLTYRYLRVSEPEFEFGTPPATATFAFDDVTKHTLTLGLRYDLYPDAVPLPPAPPAPPPPPIATPIPKNFVIFFGFGKCNISAEADAVLSEAAGVAKSSGSASVQIIGHTDSVGSPKANQKLSECRANGAKSNLVGKGIAEAAISTSGKGESELLVQTGDDVKEPQNRRATIDLK